MHNTHKHTVKDREVSSSYSIHSGTQNPQGLHQESFVSSGLTKSMFHTDWVFTGIYRKFLCGAVGFVYELLYALLDSELFLVVFCDVNRSKRTADISVKNYVSNSPPEHLKS